MSLTIMEKLAEKFGVTPSTTIAGTLQNISGTDAGGQTIADAIEEMEIGGSGSAKSPYIEFKRDTAELSRGAIKKTASFPNGQGVYECIISTHEFGPIDFDSYHFDTEHIQMAFGILPKTATSSFHGAYDRGELNVTNYNSGSINGDSSGSSTRVWYGDDSTGDWISINVYKDGLKLSYGSLSSEEEAIAKFDEALEHLGSYIELIFYAVDFSRAL